MGERPWIRVRWESVRWSMAGVVRCEGRAEAEGGVPCQRRRWPEKVRSTGKRVASKKLVRWLKERGVQRAIPGRWGTLMTRKS